MWDCRDCLPGCVPNLKLETLQSEKSFLYIILLCLMLLFVKISSFCFVFVLIVV